MSDDLAYKLAIQESYKDSLYWVANKLCGYQDLSLKTHLPIINALEAPTKRKLICVPRGTFKSSIASVAYPIWLLINNPNLRILIDSEIFTNSVKYLREIKGHLESETFKTIFGDWTTDVWNESEIIIKPRSKVLKEPSIMCGGIGTSKVGMHPDVIIGDDYNSDKNSHSDEQRNKVIEHFKMNQPILEKGGIYVVIGTRYAENDLIGWIIKEQFGLESEEEIDMFLDKKNGVYAFEG